MQYSESSDNASWGGWSALASVPSTAGNGSVSIAPPSTRGNYRRFQVRAVPSSGVGYASSWRVSSNSVRRNTLPGAPTSVVAAPAVYSNENVVITWSGARAGTSAIKGFRLSYFSATTDGSVGMQWFTIATIDLASSSGSHTFAGITRTLGTYTTLGVATIDALGVLSDRKNSNTVYCNVTPCGAPTACAVNITLLERCMSVPRRAKQR